jgi:hypothetical protein
MSGIPPKIYPQLRETLLDCGPFGNDAQLRAVFAHDSLRPWRHNLPQASGVAARMDAIVAFLLEKRRADTKENALVLFLRVLIARSDPLDECYPRLQELTGKLERALGGPASPPKDDTGKEPIEQTQIASLKRQRLQLKRSLLSVEEREVAFVDLRNIPPDLEESKKRLQERIAQVEARLAELGA